MRQIDEENDRRSGGGGGGGERKSRWRSNSDWTMGDNQLASVREVLETDGAEIARLLRMTNEAKRDIVQFIAMKTGEEDGKKVVRNKEELAKEVLKEVPKQVTDWMYMRQFATVVNV